MDRKRALRICDRKIRGRFAELFGLDQSRICLVKGYPGSANLVFRVLKNGTDFFLRISYRPDRSEEMILTETSFLNYLNEKGLKIASPVLSENGRFMEVITEKDCSFKGVLFRPAEGEFLHHQNFQMPEGVSLRKFFQNSGKILGQLHNLSSLYDAKQSKRFDWLDRHEDSLDWLLPEGMELLKSKIRKVIYDIRGIERTKRNFGLAHNDYGILNFTLDYTNDQCDLTLFDFDDCGFNYFMYDLACLWEMCTGWTFYLDNSSSRKERMIKIYDDILSGYNEYHHLCGDEKNYLVLFLKATHIENILERYRDILKNKQEHKESSEIRYHRYCLENDLEYLGLFDSVFNNEKPFEMD